MSLNVKPLGKKVLIAENASDVYSDGGIIIEKATSASMSKTGTVLAIGPDVKEVQVGDVVYLDWSKGNIVKVDGNQRVMIEEQHIAVVLEK
jgi:chaperonin GroES